MDEKQKIFYGYVFESGYSKNSEVSVKAYDQLRYLTNNDTYVISAATKAIRKVATDLGLKIGTFANTGYVVPGIVEDDKSAFDVVCKDLDSTLIATNQNFVLYDDFGSLVLRNIYDIAIPADNFFIGEDSLLFDFDYNKSIDKDTANRIKLVHDNKKTSKREVYIVQDSKNMSQGGRLQKFRKVDENMTAAQIKDLADKMIKLLNRETKTLEIDCLGNWKARAGRFIYIYLQKLGIKEYFLMIAVHINGQKGFTL